MNPPLLCATTPGMDYGDDTVTNMKTGLSVLFIVYLNTVACQEDCHCLNKTLCPNNCNSQCDPGWLGASCVTQNIAFNKTAYQTSTAQICGTSCTSLPAGLAVDGDTRTDRGTRCSRTAENKTTASLTVSFQHPQLIDRVGLYFSEENTEDRRDFQVWVEDKLCYQRPITATVTSYIQISCDQQLLGKTVSVVLPHVGNTYRILALCEIEINECARLMWGDQCVRRCSNCTDSCDQRTGQCYNRYANIADGHKAYFRPDNHGVFGTANQVIDSDTTDSNCAFVTTVNPWWEIQFNETRTVTKMKMFWSSLVIPVTFTVLVGDLTCHSQAPPTPVPPREFSFHCPTPLQGDRVRIIRQGIGSIHLKLCEVEIYECLEGFYGSSCKHRCYCQIGEMCDKSNGTCFNITTSVTSTFTTTAAAATTTSTTTITTRTTTTKTTSTLVSSLASTGTTFTTTSNTAAPSPTENATTSHKMTAQSSPADVGVQQQKANIAVSRRVKVFDVIESRFPDSIQGDPSVTTDGDTSLASCVIINGTQPSWKITFEKQHVIYGLKLYLPQSAYLQKFNVLIAGVFCYQRSSTVPVSTPYMFQCYEQIMGDSVTMYVPQSDRTVSLALCEVEVFGKSTEQMDTGASQKTDDEGLLVAAIAVPCVIAVVIVVVVIVTVVIKRKVYLCVKSKDDPVEPHYAGLEPRRDENYSSLTPLPDKNEPGPYENERIQLEGRHTYVNSTQHNE